MEGKLVIMDSDNEDKIKWSHQIACMYSNETHEASYQVHTNCVLHTCKAFLGLTLLVGFLRIQANQTKTQVTTIHAHNKNVLLYTRGWCKYQV